MGAGSPGTREGVGTMVGRDRARRGLGRRWSEAVGDTGGMWGHDRRGTAHFLLSPTVHAEAQTPESKYL